MVEREYKANGRTIGMAHALHAQRESLLNSPHMKTVPPFRAEDLEAIAQVLADTHTGLSGAEIGHILEGCRIPDNSATMTKWKRLYNAFVEVQNARHYGNHVVAFIHKAMRPVRYTGAPEHYEGKRAELNRVLAFSGLTLGKDGNLTVVQKAATLEEAEQRAHRLRTALEARGVHPDALRFCQAELLRENYFHVVLEATKSVADKVRRLSGLTSDGADLFQAAFSLGQVGRPLLAINALHTDTERGEQKGFVNLLIGLFGVVRNPTAHAEKIYWPIGEQDALDILSIVSLVHRKLDKVTRP